MRVLIVNKFAHVTGGADRHVLDLATLLRARDHEVRLVSTAAVENIEREGTFVPCTVTHADRDYFQTRRAAGVAVAAIWNHEAAQAMRLELERFRPDVVHAHKLYPQLSVSPLVMARRAGVPVVQTIHDYEFIAASPLDASGRSLDRAESRLQYRALNSITYAIRREVHRRAVARWIAVSRHVANAHRRAGISAQVLPNFTLIATGGEPIAFGERRGIVFVGRLVPEKGVGDVLSLARAAPGIPFDVIGGGAIERVRAAAAAVSNVTVRGPLPENEAAAAIRSARLVVVPSRWEEPGPLVAVEAMAAGTPVVAYDIGGLGEYVRNAGVGAVVPPSPEHLAAACVDLYGDPRRWNACSKRGRHAAATVHSPTAYTTALERIYEKVHDAAAV